MSNNRYVLIKQVSFLIFLFLLFELNTELFKPTKANQLTKVKEGLIKALVKAQVERFPRNQGFKDNANRQCKYEKRFK